MLESAEACRFPAMLVAVGLGLLVVVGDALVVAVLL